MRLFQGGVEPVAFIAVGVAPTGVIAIGVAPSGVIAIGQLARGMIAIGQLAIGLLAFGQLAVGGVWAGGQLALAPLEGPSMLGAGLFGRLGLRDLVKLRWSRVTSIPFSGLRRTVAPTLLICVLILVWFVAVGPLVHDITRLDGIFRESPRPLR